ncbi:hypothetical protein, partial [Coleofasciculus sp. FACHB-712]|uniref:hypothetical protein n=1 Tax=Coleofasciculus sp. FACHB-712 TaxID=2692789 RepID=UPI001A7E3484
GFARFEEGWVQLDKAKGKRIPRQRLETRARGFPDFALERQKLLPFTFWKSLERCTINFTYLLDYFSL